ncbi:MAG: transcription elongation factor subunit Spt4 [Nanoarchaeota archaeon]|nr:transcription elongation factor subunit Spt4 [Nanoarchaeota archaeon]
MVKEKACSTCKILYEGQRCPICNETTFTESFKGRVRVFNPEESEVAKEMKITLKGEYAIKTK